MSFLDSILNNLEKPPTIEKPVIKDKEKREKYEKLVKEREEAEKRRKQELTSFRSKFERKLQEFLAIPINEDDHKTYKLASKPMDKLHRTIVNEVCEDFIDDVCAFSFGVEDVDRHSVIYKRGYEPCDEELKCLKMGVEYKPKRELEEDEDDCDNPEAGKQKKMRKPTEKEIVQESLKIETAQAVVPGKQYGFVPVALKTDLRSVEQVMIDQQKQKQKKQEQEES